MSDNNTFGIAYKYYKQGFCVIPSGSGQRGQNSGGELSHRVKARQSMTVFDEQDISYLANTLTESQLKSEIRSAEIAGCVADQFRGPEWEDEGDHFPYADYKLACEKALAILKENTPKPKPARGKIDIEKIKQSCDIVAVIGKYTKLRKVGNRFVGCCPIHPDKHPSLVVYPAQQSWYCFGCNRGGDVLDFVMTIENLDLRQAVAKVGVT